MLIIPLSLAYTSMVSLVYPMIVFILSHVSYPLFQSNLTSQIRIWKFPVAVNIFKFLHISSILIPVVEGFDELSVVHYFLTKIYLFHHEFSFLLQEILYLGTFIGAVMIIQKGVTQ